MDFVRSLPHGHKKKKPKTEARPKNELLTAQFLVTRALQGFYAQSENDVVASLICSSGKYPGCEELLPQCAQEGVWRDGNFSQGYAPKLKAEAKPSELVYSKEQQEAYFVRASWIWTHLLLGPALYDGDFGKGVQLVDRLAKLLRVQAATIRNGSRSMAALLDLQLPVVEPNACKHPTARRSHPRRDSARREALVPDEEKSTERKAFEQCVLHVLDWRLALAKDDDYGLHDIMINPTGLPKTYYEMT